MARCRNSACEEEIGSRWHFYCSEHWRELFGGLREEAYKILCEVDSAYVGRTNYPERRLIEHRTAESRNFNRMLVLHWSGDWFEIHEIERRLVNEVQKLTEDEDLQGDIGKTGGRWQGDWNCVYLAWKSEQKLPAIAKKIQNLDVASRLPPRVGITKLRPTLLGTDLSAREAEERLKQLEAERKVFFERIRKEPRRKQGNDG